MRLKLTLTRDRLTVCQLSGDAPLPPWAAEPGPIVSVTRTPGELTIVCPDGRAPAATRQEAGWRALRIQGPLDFSLTGILASVLEPLARARIGIFAVSTFDTDYVLVKETRADAAVQALRAAGHEVALE